MRGLFIAGTDTGCGKTTVGTVLARSARERGMRVRVLKPVETGCVERDGQCVPEDAIQLARAAADNRPLDQICPYRLRLAAAPQVAAQHENLTLEWARIEKAYREAASDADLVLVESAGGLLVPLTPELDMTELARRLALPVLLVARARLGTLNHTLLSLEAARARDLGVLGVVVSHTTPDLPPAERVNLDLLLERLPVPCLGELPFAAQELVPEAGLTALLDALARA